MVFIYAVPLLFHFVIQFSRMSVGCSVKDCIIFSLSDCNLLCRSLIGWGSTHCFTDVGIRVRVMPITKGTPEFFFGHAGYN